MCGLVGILSKRSNGLYKFDGDMFTEMLWADQLRGFDATGVIGITMEGNVDIKKQAVAAHYFVRSTKYQEFMSKMISKGQVLLGHNRKATSGDKRDSQNAHPFWDEENKIILIHNGTISNQKEFCSTSVVDSCAIAQGIAKKGYKEIIPEIQGSFALIWYDVDQKKVFFTRNEARPLSIVECEYTYALVSEPDMGKWIVGRNNGKVINVTPVDPYQIYAYDLESKKIEEVEKLEKKNFYISTTGQNTVVNFRTGTNYNSRFNEHPPYQRSRALNLWEDIEDDTFNIDEAHPMLYIGGADVITVTEAMATFKKGMRINFLADTYEESGNNAKSVKQKLIRGIIPNTYLEDKVELRMYVSNGLFELLDIANVLEVEILSVVQSEGKCIIYCNSATIEEQDTYITTNDKFVTGNMWMGNAFKNVCSECNSTISWNVMEKCDVTFHNYKPSRFLCPTCTEKQNNVQNNPSPV